MKSEKSVKSEKLTVKSLSRKSIDCGMTLKCKIPLPKFMNSLKVFSILVIGHLLDSKHIVISNRVEIQKSLEFTF